MDKERSTSIFLAKGPVLTIDAFTREDAEAIRDKLNKALEKAVEKFVLEAVGPEEAPYVNIYCDLWK